jgi:glycosyltransferase involved in cell wall biosynthesis
MRLLSLSNCPLDDSLGSGKAVLRYAEGLRMLGHEVDLLAPNDFELLPALNRARPYRQAAGIWRMIHTRLRIQEYDLVEMYGAEFWPIPGYASQWNVRPLLVAHTNGFEPLALMHDRLSGRPKVNASIKLQQVFWDRFFSGTDRFVCMSSVDRDHAVALGYYRPGETAIVQHGVDSWFFKSDPLAGKSNEIAFSGSWISRKNINVLTYVMKSVLEMHSQVTFHVYGSGVEQDIVLNEF